MSRLNKFYRHKSGRLHIFITSAFDEQTGARVLVHEQIDLEQQWVSSEEHFEKNYTKIEYEEFKNLLSKTKEDA